jgi:hypothetical protein
MKEEDKLIITKKWQNYVIDNAKESEKEMWRNFFKTSAREPDKLDKIDKKTFKEVQKDYKDFVRKNRKGNTRWG